MLVRFASSENGFIFKKWFEISLWRFFYQKQTTLRLTATEIDRDKLKMVIDTNLHHTTWEIIDFSQISKLNVEKYLHHFDYVSHLDIWVPHELSECISISHPFRKCMVTGDDKWILYNNVKHIRSKGRHYKPPQTTRSTDISSI